MHSNKVTAAILVDGKSLFEDKANVYIPFGKEYQVFIKNDNDFDIKVVIGVGLNFGEDAFYIKKKSKKTISGFSYQGKFYSYKFIEKNEAIKKNRISNSMDCCISITVHKAQPDINVLFNESTKIQKNSPFITNGQHGNIKPREIDTSKIEGCISENELKKLQDKLKGRDFLEYDNIGSDSNLRATFNSVASNTLSVDFNEGMTTFGKPISEDSIPKPSSMGYLFVFCVSLKGVDEEGNKIIKPLLAKDNIKCTICDKKCKPSDSFCSSCGSYIIKTAEIIDEINKVEKKCCNQVYPNNFIYCPQCRNEL